MASASPVPSPRGADAQQRRAANRENLRNHYGLGMQRKGSGTGSARSKGKGKEVEGDPLDIESPAFSAQAYYNNLITTASLPQLVKASTSLTSDVKNLDSSRHSLVYNHHHQLFAAGDTISHLNSRTPELEEIVKSLQESFDEISTLVEAIQVGGAAGTQGQERSAAEERLETLRRRRRRLELRFEAGASVEDLQADLDATFPPGGAAEIPPDEAAIEREMKQVLDSAKAKRELEEVQKSADAGLDT